MFTQMNIIYIYWYTYIHSRKRKYSRKKTFPNILDASHSSTSLAGRN